MIFKKSPRLLSVFFLLLSFTLICGTAYSYYGIWEKVGEKKVDYKLDHDRLDVSVRNGKFQQLLFEVNGGAINMNKCMVYFKNGETQDISLKYNFKKGSNSRVIDLKGNERLIDHIDFWYDTKKSSGRKAVLVVWGK